MERWMYLLKTHNYIWRDEMWPDEVRLSACKVLQRTMLDLGVSNIKDDIYFMELLEKFRTGK